MSEAVGFLVHNQTNTKDIMPEYLKCSPLIYAHNLGAFVPAIIKEIDEKMETRRGDVDYTAARLVEVICNLEHSKDSGVALQENTFADYTSPTEFELIPFGKAGLIVYDCYARTVSAFGSVWKKKDFDFLPDLRKEAYKAVEDTGRF